MSRGGHFKSGHLLILSCRASKLPKFSIRKLAAAMEYNFRCTDLKLLERSVVRPVSPTVKCGKHHRNVDFQGVPYREFPQTNRESLVSHHTVLGRVLATVVLNPGKILHIGRENER